MAYIKSDNPPKPGPKGCIFCDKPDENDDSTNLIVYRGNDAFVLMNLFPYNNGHLMVAPYLHTSSLAELPDATLLEIMQLTQAAQEALRVSFRPDGYNIGMNLGTVAGAGIADHLHMHIVPRWNGDANFMPVIGETKVLPDSLENSYRKIREAWPIHE
jgi:ATP adenylyltransferase